MALPLSSSELPSDTKHNDNTATISLESDLTPSSSSIASSEDNTFVQIKGREDYAPIASYEGRHRYDSSFSWSQEEEKRIVRKIDLRICTWVCLAFFALQLDRANIIQALSDNMLSDLHLSTNQYNTGQMIFYVCFLCAELPSQLISKKLGPDRWIPIQMVCWSLVASFQAFLSGAASFYICRALLGVIEGGFIPDNILYLSYWYKGGELPRRLSYFWTSYQATSIIGALLASAILDMRGVLGLAGWRWLFALEGTLTGLIGIATYFYLPPSPTQTASRFRGRKGWFSVHEEKILVNRILRDDPSKGDMHNRQAVTPRLLWRALKDYDMWPVYLLGLTFLVPTQPPTQYLSLTLKQAHFTRFQINLLTIPAYVLFIINLLWLTWLSEKLNQRFLVGLISQLWTLPCLIALVLIPASSSRWTKFTLSTLIVGTPYAHAINVAITSRNAGSVRTRTVASALYNMAVQASNIYGAQIYRAHDAPMYRQGNSVLIGISLWSALVFIGSKFYYEWRNRTRQWRWDAWSQEQREAYLEGTKDRGNKLVTFRFAS